MQRARGVVLRGVVVLALVAIVVAGAGCSAFDDGTDNGEDATPTVASTPTPEPTPTEEQPPNGQASAAFDVSILNATGTAVAGEPITVGVEVENVGGAAGTGTISLGNATESVELAPDASATVALNWSAADPGTHELTVASENDTATATVEVLEAAPEFTVAIAEADGPVADRDPLAVTVDVTNEGTVGATQTLNLTAGDAVVNSTTVTLDSGESATATLTWATATPHGERDLTVSSANDTASTTVTVEAIEEPAVAGQVSVMTEDLEAESGSIRLYDQENGEQLASQDLEPDGEFRFTDLEPGTEYRLEIWSAEATHPATDERVGGTYGFPTTEHTFTAEEIQQSIDLVYGHKIRGAETYRWEFFKQSDLSNRYEGYGRYNQSDAYSVEILYAGSFEPTVRQMIYIDNKTFLNSTNAPAPVWYEDPPVDYEPPTTKPHQIVQSPIKEFADVTRRFRGRTTVNETTAYEYSLSGLRDYPEATVYIDPETGYIIKWEAEHHYTTAQGDIENYPAELWFWDHNTDSIIIESPR